MFIFMRTALLFDERFRLFIWDSKSDMLIEHHDDVFIVEKKYIEFAIEEKHIVKIGKL